jgi:hypothetical protein
MPAAAGDKYPSEPVELMRGGAFVAGAAEKAAAAPVKHRRLISSLFREIYRYLLVFVRSVADGGNRGGGDFLRFRSRVIRAAFAAASDANSYISDIKALLCESCVLDGYIFVPEMIIQKSHVAAHHELGDFVR